jgi:hypothetical protein
MQSKVESEGYAVQMQVEVKSLDGHLGEVLLDPGHATAWDLVNQVHSHFPLPCGMFWKLVMEDKMVAHKSIPITRNSVVTCVKCVPAMHERMHAVLQAEQLLLTGRSVDDLPLESHLIWQTLQSLTFGGRFNQNMDNVTLPSGLKSLTFANNFDQSLDNVTLPSDLQNLTLSKRFNQSMNNVTLPSGLQSLTFGSEFNQSTDNMALPSGLQNLISGDGFNQSMSKVTMPSCLQSCCPAACRACMNNVTLPSGNDFDQSMDKVILPCGRE